MTQEKFEPNASLGDLLVLARIAELFYEHNHANPGNTFREESRASKTRVRDALIRLAASLGEIEVSGGHRRSQLPSMRGYNIGLSGRLANVAIGIAKDPKVDQARLQMQLKSVIAFLEQQHATGELDIETIQP